MTTPPRKERQSSRSTSERKSNAGRKPGRKFTDYLHVLLSPPDRAVVTELAELRGTNASDLVRSLLHEEKARIGAKKDNEA